MNLPFTEPFFALHYVIRIWCHTFGQLLYSGLFSWVEIFVKSWKRPPELNFVVLNFVSWYYAFAHVMWTLNSVHAMRILALTRNARSQTLTRKSGYARLEEKWSASVSTLAWEASRSTKHELRWCSHTWTRCTGPVHASALFTSLFTSSITTRGTAWERGPYGSRALSTGHK